MSEFGERDSEERLGEVSDKLSEDLKALFGSGSGVPGEVDRAVLDAARRKLVKPRRRRFVKWGSWIGTAAAIVLLVFMVNGPWDKGQGIQESANVAGDIDGNGRVDVLDAFKLAKSVESPGAADARWDVNGDGTVDSADVDEIAYFAVRLSEGV